MAIIKEPIENSRVVTEFDHGGMEWRLKKTTGNHTEIEPADGRPVLISSDPFATTWSLEFWLDRSTTEDKSLVKGYNIETHPSLLSALDRAVALCMRVNGLRVAGKTIPQMRTTTPCAVVRRTRESYHNERIETIKRLAAEGHTAEVIGQQVGLTKNAVIGACYRRNIKLHGQQRYGSAKGNSRNFVVHEGGRV